MITTVVGSYPKIPDPPASGRWRSAKEKLEQGEISSEEFLQVEREVTLEVIREQVEAGIELITDGQIRWEDSQTYFARGLTGFTLNGLQRWFDTNMYYRIPVAEGEVLWTDPISVEDYRFAKARSPRPVKPVITGPYTLARLSQNRYYADFEDFVLNLALALNQELRALDAEDPPLIQVDEPAILKYKSDFPLFREAMITLTEGVRAPLALYTYFGDVTGIYPEILDLPFDAIGLDFVAGPRNWEVLEKAPFEKWLGFGILDARNTRLESVEELVRALDRVSRYVPLDRVYLNPSAGLEFLPRQVARAKLQRLVEAKRAALGVGV
ncbi:MAG: methylcobamide--CoM methyltransferase [Armatimonadota bacterium]|nr:methylcobamide--CoM methyltransferase [Armatimonadota bacterium]MDR7438280.1 methylcobamide--CoM methyltransferase [Armatimonadota bacterium]MDR7443398.1 methylcobamide--CoM methyltransferase [Armatimonadota bacterium]MDR7563397.1 methylcobamide--CoM methyltransferase [Armatimonadota bacterium]MDR7567684.1 methylcobamide--CoM methyltransferase [Armatimonadota bacterium]